jgi:hypothetical protein
MEEKKIIIELNQDEFNYISICVADGLNSIWPSVKGKEQRYADLFELTFNDDLGWIAHEEVYIRD